MVLLCGVDDVGAGVTALMHCAKRYSEHHLCILHFLVKHGAEVNAATMNGWTASTSHV